MNISDEMFAGARTILDVGGWFKPERRATHVVDLMPWETRGAKLTLERLPGENFTKETWIQADFLKPGFALPFADKSFDLVTCGHTIEDLAAPAALILEMQRVGRHGVIECPSRLYEQTQGIRDRESRWPGHPHHHWIVESEGGKLVLYSKAASALSAGSRLVPLTMTEALTAAAPGAQFCIHPWAGAIEFTMETDEPTCRRRADAFVGSLQVPLSAATKDSFLRWARRVRTAMKGGREAENLWWSKIVEVSRPYSSISLG